MKSIVLTTLLSFFLLNNIYCQYSCDGVFPESTLLSQQCTENSNAYLTKYKKINSYQDNNSVPVKTLKIAFHIWLGSNGEGCWTESDQVYSDFQTYEIWFNQFYRNLVPSSESFSPVGPADSKIEIEITGVYFYYNNGTFNTESASTLNDYIENNYPDRINSLPIHCVSTNCSAGSGFSTGTSYHNDSFDPCVVTRAAPTTLSFSFAQHIAHEMGHCLNLLHTYDGSCNGIWGSGADVCCPETNVTSSYEYISDIFNLNDNWCSSPAPFCYECQTDDAWDNNGHSSNNFMASRPDLYYYLSPQQFAKIHRASQIKSVRQFIWGYSDLPLEISSNEIWDFSIKMYNDILIKAGATLTIQCEVQFVPQAGIIIESGGKLILDGGILTRAVNSEDFWKGIEVLGNSTQFQNSLNQGHLIVRNGGIIEFAQNAVLVGKEGDATKGGGLVQATNSIFRNNVKNVKYLPYNFYSFTTGNEVLNKGRFLNCEFLWDENFIGSSAHSGFDINHVNGVIISGCTFRDDRTTVTNPHERPFGIISLDAGYKVLGRNLGPLNSPIHHNYDETNMDVSYFKNLREGIYAMNALSQNSITVDHAKFEDMVYGIHLSSVDNAILTRNMFNYTFMHPSDISVMHEMALSKSTGFTVEGNIFMKQPATFMVEGTLVYNSGFAANRIYRNTYENLYTSNYANGENTNDLSGGDQPIGLQFLCNDYSFSNKYDEYVYTFPNANGNGQGIRLKQGTSTKPAGNTFSLLNPGQGKAHIKSLDFDNIIYFAYNSPPQVPTILDGGIGNQLTVNQNTCLSTFNGIISPNGGVLVSSTTQIQLLNDLQTINSNYQQKSNELSALLADGNTQYLHDLVANLSNSNRQTVKAELLNASPYLSEELLIELGEKTPSIFPPTWYKSILEANVEIVQNKSFIYYLNNKPDPLAPGLVNNIIQYGMTHSTIRGTKMDELTDLNTEKSVILNYLISNEMSDSSEVNWTAYKDYLVQRDDIICRAQLADMYLGKRETSECDAKLDDIDVHINEYMVDEVKQEMMDYSTFKKYILNIIDSSSLILSLTPEQITQLNYVADNFRGKSSIQAKNLLCYLTGQCEDLLVEYGEGNGNKMADGLNSELITVNSTNLEIMPNPNIGEFNVKVPNDCAILNVYVNDIQGRKVEFSMDNLDGNKINLEIKEPESGIYLISVECQGETFTSRIIVK